MLSRCQAPQATNPCGSVRPGATEEPPPGLVHTGHKIGNSHSQQEWNKAPAHPPFRARGSPQQRCQSCPRPSGRPCGHKPDELPVADACAAASALWPVLLTGVASCRLHARSLALPQWKSDGSFPGSQHSPGVALSKGFCWVNRLQWDVLILPSGPAVPVPGPPYCWPVERRWQCLLDRQPAASTARGSIGRPPAIRQGRPGRRAWSAGACSP